MPHQMMKQNSFVRGPVASDKMAHHAPLQWHCDIGRHSSHIVKHHRSPHNWRPTWKYNLKWQIFAKVCWELLEGLKVSTLFIVSATLLITIEVFWLLCLILNSKVKVLFYEVHSKILTFSPLICVSLFGRFLNFSKAAFWKVHFEYYIYCYCIAMFLIFSITCTQEERLKVNQGREWQCHYDTRHLRS